TADHMKAAREMLRVCRSSGKIGLANWTPEGFIGQLFRVISQYMPPPAGVKSPAMWGTRAYLHDLFGADASASDIPHRTLMFRYRSTQHWIDVFSTYYGPVLKTLAAVPDEKRASMLADVEALIARLNVAKDGTMIVPAEYLEVIVVKR